MEILLIKNALSGQSTECELDPSCDQYAIPKHVWQKWSESVRNHALREFILGNPPFLHEFDVSLKGITCQRKRFRAIAGKPGSTPRKRRRSEKVIIKKSNAHIQYDLLY